MILLLELRTELSQQTDLRQDFRLGDVAKLDEPVVKSLSGRNLPYYGVIAFKLSTSGKWLEKSASTGGRPGYQATQLVKTGTPDGHADFHATQNR